VPRPLPFRMLRGILRTAFTNLSDQRRGDNGQYSMCDAAFGAFGVFYTQCRSFLAYQRLMQQRNGRNNAQSLFGVEHIPTDPQIRNLLDSVPLQQVQVSFWDIFALLADAGYVRDFQFANTLLCSLDGTQYFSSTNVHCQNCTVSVHGETTRYAHTILIPALVRPDKAEIIVLEPEFITPQDGAEKQDCERNAAHRWVKRNAAHFAGQRVTILADDLHCNQPTCQLLLDHHLDFIMTCKPDSHVTLYEEVTALAAMGAVGQIEDRTWTGKGHERRTYRWVSQVPLRADAQALTVNWCDVTIVSETTGEVLYHNAFATSHVLNEQTVRDVVAAGRSRWKIENEGNNVLKNQGYCMEHNYGHGSQNLSMILLSFLLLAFLCHTVLQLADATYQRIRAALVTRKEFFDDIRALTRYLYFESWEALLAFMATQLQLAPD
jgi:hypothetical protein